MTSEVWINDLLCSDCSIRIVYCSIRIVYCSNRIVYNMLLVCSYLFIAGGCHADSESDTIGSSP